jgi:ribose 5-phosphate isomerase A
VIIVDAAKVKTRLGAFPLPVEVIPFGHCVVAERIRALGGAPTLRRRRDGEPFVSDEGHWILDAAFGAIADPESLSDLLLNTPGVVEHGLFLDLAGTVLVGGEDGSVRRLER